MISQITMKWSLQNLAHVKTAALSWHVQKFVRIARPGRELQQNVTSIEFGEKKKHWSEMVPLDDPLTSQSEWVAQCYV